MGLLDSMFGGGQDQGQSQGPQSPGVFGRMAAQYAPGAYSAEQQAKMQQAVYQAALQTPGMSPQVAQALAMSPQFFQAQQGAYLPSAPQVTPVTGSDGSQTLFQTNNAGGGAGHGISISGIPITPTPPGTTGSPQAAAGAAAAPAQGDNAPAPVQNSNNTISGMPGSSAAILNQIKANKAAGKDPTLGVPDGYKSLAQAVLDGRETLKDITSTRGAQTRNAVNEIALALDPSFDENMNEARNNYRKQYVSGKATDIGGQVKSINKLAGHANAVADAIKNQDNIGMGGVGILAHPINKMTNALYSTPGAELERKADLYNTELSSYLSGKGQSGVEERGSRKALYDPSAGKTPQEMGTALLSDIEFLEKQMEGNEQQRNSVFTNPKLQQQFPLVSPEARQQLNEAKVKAHKLIGDYDEWSKTSEATGQGAGQPSLPPGWKHIK